MNNHPSTFASVANHLHLRCVFGGTQHRQPDGEVAVFAMPVFSATFQFGEAFHVLAEAKGHSGPISIYTQEQV